MHYVDGYACVEAKHTINSSYIHTHNTLGTMGFKFKKSKLQPPSSTQKIQGITMTITPTAFNLTPMEHRRSRITAAIQETLQQNAITADQALKLAGKIQFMQEAGQGIRACIHPLWKLATAGCHTKHTQQLPADVQDALRTLVILIHDFKPVKSPFTKPEVAIVYADAFFKAGEKEIRLSQATDDWDWNPEASNLLHNGWGFVTRLPNQEVIFARGEFPGRLLGHFTTRRAYIYALEVLSQALALIAGQHVLTEFTWFYCDNEAGRCALLKGYGKETKLNRLISCCWQLATARNIGPAFDRVSSKANISDEISRNDLVNAVNLGWKEIVLPWNEIYEILARATKSLEAATSAAVKLRRHGWGRESMAGVRDHMDLKETSSNLAPIAKKRKACEVSAAD